MTLTTEQENLYRASFNDCDLNGDGKISHGELLELLKKHCKDVTDDEATKIIQEIDANGDGFLQFEEYIEVVNEFVTDKLTAEAMLAAFGEMDADGNGHITKDELKKFMKNAGQRLSKKELAQMMKDADTNNDGRVNYNEFVKMIAN